MPRSRGFVLDILPQTHDKIINRSRICIFAKSPNILEYHTPRDDLAFMIDQVAQQVRFHQREMYSLRAGTQFEGFEVDRLPTEIKHLRLAIVRHPIAIFLKPLTTP